MRSLDMYMKDTVEFFLHGQFFEGGLFIFLHVFKGIFKKKYTVNRFLQEMDWPKPKIFYLVKL